MPSVVSGCRLTLPSLRSEKTHNDVKRMLCTWHGPHVHVILHPLTLKHWCWCINPWTRSGIQSYTCADAVCRERMLSDSSIAAVRKDTQRRETNALHLTWTARPCHPTSAYVKTMVLMHKPLREVGNSIIYNVNWSSRTYRTRWINKPFVSLCAIVDTLQHSSLVATSDTCVAHLTPW